MGTQGDKRRGELVPREAGLNVSERAEMLRELFPEAVAEGKVDWDKLRAALGDVVDGKAERYSFSWAGKRHMIRSFQIPCYVTAAWTLAEMRLTACSADGSTK